MRAEAASQTHYSLGGTDAVLDAVLDAVGRARSVELNLRTPVERTRAHSVEAGVGTAYRGLVDATARALDAAGALTHGGCAKLAGAGKWCSTTSASTAASALAWQGPAVWRPTRPANRAATTRCRHASKRRARCLRVFGAALSLLSAWQILQGVQTLPLRMERHCSNALAVARFLQADPRVSFVNYPGLPDHPQHVLLMRQMQQMRGASGLLAFGVKGGEAAGVKFIVSARFMSHLVNIGDTRTLVSHPASTTHRQLDAAQQLAAGVRPDMVRISVGLKHIDDILWDVDQALAAACA